MTDKLKDVLENSKDEESGKVDLDIKSEQIIWNLTGGQRHTMMACQKLMLERLREYKVKDEMIYLDGDHGVIYRQGYDQQGYLTDVKKGNKKVECYRFDGDLDLALELAGFTMVKKNIGTNLDNINFLGSNNKGKKFDQIKDIVKQKTGNPYLTNGEIIKFYEAYIKEENEELRKACIVSNKNNETYDKVEKELNRDGIIIEELVKKLEGIHKTKAFGYLLEYMTLYQVYETLAGCEGIKGVYHSVNVYREKPDKKSSYCEFDIVLMTTKGQLLVIECKSGIMPGDTGKGRQFTVYATNGVYGTPILITPLIEGDMDDNDKILQDESYQYVKKTTDTAQRINLNFWYIDKIKKGLTDYLKARGVK